jgi:hypothetical protein
MAPLYPPMQMTILLVSRDESLQATRALILEMLGTGLLAVEAFPVRFH